MADNTDNLLLKSVLSGNDRLPYSTLATLAGAPNGTDQEAQNLSDIAGSFQPNSVIGALLKGVAGGVAMSKKDQAQAKRDELNNYLQTLTQTQVQNQQHQQEMEDMIQSHVYAQAKQGQFVDGMTSVINGGDPQPVIDVMNGVPSMQRTVARQFGVDPSSQLVDLQVTKDRNQQEHLIGTFTDAQGNKFTAPTQIDASKVLNAVAQPVLAARAADAAKASLDNLAKQAEIAKNEASAAKDAADAKTTSEGGLTGQQRVNAEMKLADDYRTATKNFTQLSSGYNQIKTAYDMAKNDTTGASQISLLYGYMKMLDPNSVVREGEFATAENAPGIPSRVLNAYNAVVNGQKIAPEALKSYMDNATALYQSQGKIQKQIETQFRDAATRYKLNPDNIIVGAPGATMLDEPLTPPAAKGTTDATPTTAPSQQMLAPPSGAGMFKDGQTATNPQTGQKIVFKGGQWLPK